MTLREIPREYFTSRDAGTLRVCNELCMHSRGKTSARLCKLLVMGLFVREGMSLSLQELEVGELLLSSFPLHYNIAS